MASHEGDYVGIKRHSCKEEVQIGNVGRYHQSRSALFHKFAEAGTVVYRMEFQFEKQSGHYAYEEPVHQSVSRYVFLLLGLAVRFFSFFFCHFTHSVPV